MPQKVPNVDPLELSLCDDAGASVPGIADGVIVVTQLDAPAVDGRRVDQRPFFGGLMGDAPGVEVLIGSWVNGVSSAGEARCTCFIF